MKCSTHRRLVQQLSVVQQEDLAEQLPALLFFGSEALHAAVVGRRAQRLQAMNCRFTSRMASADGSRSLAVVPRSLARCVSCEGTRLRRSGLRSRFPRPLLPSGSDGRDTERIPRVSPIIGWILSLCLCVDDCLDSHSVCVCVCVCVWVIACGCHRASVPSLSPSPATHPLPE